GHCGSCVSVCAPMAIVLLDTFVMVDLGVCTGCLDCVYACPVGAIEGR
ncbi:MAG: 4Fe-4S binding protein, partial [Candidatus Falkowbacteria bacterium]